METTKTSINESKKGIEPIKDNINIKSSDTAQALVHSKALFDSQLDSLIDIVRTLRGENGCPWDKKQTPETMWKCLVEEVYELLGAIESGDVDDICDEMGDVLFQFVFIAELYREKKAFDLQK